MTNRPSLLEQLSQTVNIDADTLNEQFIASLPIRCHDVTSNQGFVHEALTADVNKELVERTVREMKGAPWEEVYAVCVCPPCDLWLMSGCAIRQECVASHLWPSARPDVCSSRFRRGLCI
jgi:hypothetical protein